MEFVAIVVLLVDTSIGLGAIQRFRRAWRYELSPTDGSRPPARTLAYQLLWRAQLDQVSFEQLHVCTST